MGNAKPSKEIFTAASRKLGVGPSETLMIGDDLDEDYKGAKAAGIQPVLLQRSRHDADYVRVENSQEALRGVECITSLEKLLPLLKNRQS